MTRNGSFIVVCLAIAFAACASAPRTTMPDGGAPEPGIGRTIEVHSDTLVRDAALAADSFASGDRGKSLSTAFGEATYYADLFEGRPTASGIVFSNSRMFAAHREYPFGTVLRVIDVESGRAVVVQVVDRLPPARTERARRTIIDLSRRAAERLGFIRAGRIPVQIEVLHWGQPQ